MRIRTFGGVGGVSMLPLPDWLLMMKKNLKYEKNTGE
jgi:hypothetical protein